MGQDTLKRAGEEADPARGGRKRGDLKGGECINVSEASRLIGIAALTGPADRMPSAVFLLNKGTAAANLADDTTSIGQNDREQGALCASAYRRVPYRACSQTQGRPNCDRISFREGVVANRLGMRTESLSRALAKLSQLGVRVEKEIVLIDDLGNLRQFVRYPESAGEKKPLAQGC